MDANKSTAHFVIPRLTPEDGGLWECRVSTEGGQDFCKFNLTVKGKAYLYKILVIKQIVTMFLFGWIAMVRYKNKRLLPNV